MFIFRLLFLTVSFFGYTTLANDQPYPVELKYVSDCCAPSIKSNDEILLKCVNASAEQSVIDGWEDPKKTKFAFVTYGTEHISGYSSYAFAVNQAYCEQNGHILRLADPLTSNFEPTDVRWNKVKILETSLKTWAKEADYIIWLDADLIIIDIGMNLEIVVKKYPHAHLWASASPESTTNTDVMNSGLLILKNSDFVNNWLLKQWWNYEQRNAYSDQEVFNMLYIKFGDKLASKVVILEPNALNSDPPATLKQKPGNQIIHLMGEFDRYRRGAFMSAFEDICRVTYTSKYDYFLDENGHTNDDLDELESDNYESKEPRKLKYQYGLDQPRLMAIAIREYSNHSRYLMDEFHTRLQAEGKHNNYDRSSGLSYYTKRYVDMIEFIETHWSTKDKKAIKMGSWTTVDEHILSESFDDDPAFPDILEYKRKNKSVMGTHPESSTELRRKLLNLFLKNFEKSEDLEETVNEEDSNELFKARQERSSLLYVTIDYASHFVKIHLVKRMKSKTGNMIVIITPEDEEAEELLDRIIVLSDELMKMVHIERKAHCHHLRSDLFVDRSLFHRFRDEIDKSFEYLFLALREKEEEAAILGDLCLSKVLIIIADQFCQDKRYKESFPYFDRAIKIQKDHVGENQMSLGIYSYMAAQARAAAGTDHKKAISLLRNAIKIFEMYPNSEEYQRDIPRMTQLISYIQNKMNNES